ncbi:unnamed protein product [Microthlaspi erraticum]|uniref:Pentacotripeptide-repeat region of PRORP domain-containing protein n=1 Tax=Microthlaspi erraticum TaxID=1685480 RepID=A0A6D2L1A3_9BRAS|nr:unnamed protein product [Microthlaspi erraticum]
MRRSIVVASMAERFVHGQDNAIELFDDMVRCRPFPSAIDFNKLMGVIVRMNRPDIVISLYQMMEMRRIPFDIYSMSILIKCFCTCEKLPFALSTFGKITKLGSSLTSSRLTLCSTDLSRR